MDKSKVEGMKSKPAGGADRSAFGKDTMPTNSGKAVGGLRRMLGAIKHIGRPSKPNKLPMA